MSSELIGKCVHGFRGNTEIYFIALEDVGGSYIQGTNVVVNGPCILGIDLMASMGRKEFEFSEDISREEFDAAFDLAVERFKSDISEVAGPKKAKKK